MIERQLLDILVRFATTLTADFSIEDVLDNLVEQAVDLLPVTGAGVLLMDDDLHHHFVAATDDKIERLEGIQVELDEGPCLAAYHTGSYVAIPALAADGTLPTFSPAADAMGFGAVFCFPLRVGSERIGALELYASGPVELSSAELVGGQTLADVVASYLMIARRRDRAAEATALLADAALRDPLTGLPNRRLLDDRLEQAIERSRRTGVAFAVLFCDLDDFKSINDRFGHRTGDRVLLEVGARLTRCLRPYDTLARVSGDEFVILCEALPDIGLAEEVAMRLLSALHGPFRLSGCAQDIELGMSVGVALAGTGGDTSEHALRRADMAMYRAKRDGGGHAVATELDEASRSRRPLLAPTRA